MYKIWGASFMSIFSVFSVMTGWIAEMLFMLFFASSTVTLANPTAIRVMTTMTIITS